MIRKRMSENELTACSDLVFVLDCTGSMQRYINATRDHVYGICDMIRGEEGLGGPDDLRVAVGLISTHPYAALSWQS